MISYNSVSELAQRASAAGKKISEIVLHDQSVQLERTQEDLYSQMEYYYKVMQESIEKGLNCCEKSESGLSGGDAYKLNKRLSSGDVIGGTWFSAMLAKALAVSEYNASMGRIVAAPTAGSCGIIPAVLMTAVEEREISEHDAVMSLFTASGIGLVIANRATVSGAEGGCQAECGSASAMAASALVEMLGGSPYEVCHACALALKNFLGLVCDPVAGLVEVPCVKRNAIGAAVALAAAQMALAGIESRIPADEVIDVMKAIGHQMPNELKETAIGGLAATTTGKGLKNSISSKTKHNHLMNNTTCSCLQK